MDAAASAVRLQVGSRCRDDGRIELHTNPVERAIQPIRASLDPWITKSRTSLVSSSANGIGKDRGAVLPALTSPWCSGQAEGQITRLKLVKRQMYGRAKLDLLEAQPAR